MNIANTHLNIMPDNSKATLEAKHQTNWTHVQLTSDGASKIRLLFSYKIRM